MDMVRKILDLTEKIERDLDELNEKAEQTAEKLDQRRQDEKQEDENNSLKELLEELQEQNSKIDHLKKVRGDLLKQCRDLSPADRVVIARLPSRPHVDDFISHLFTDFFEQKGDHLYDEDKSIYGGIALFHGIPVTVLGHRKGCTVEENIKYNFGMPCPEGYRKALRMMQQAEKFKRPIITFIDTPGAYPGLEAEAHGQGEAIARNLAYMSHLTVPVISVCTGEGNSGGALALSVCNRLIMLENSVYSVLSPEGFASILWKDSSRHEEACGLMKLTAEDLKNDGICDEIVPEPVGGAQIDPDAVYNNLDEVLFRHLKELKKMSVREVVNDRHKKFRYI